MTEFEEPPFDLHPADRVTTDLTAWRNTLSIIAGIILGSMFAGGIFLALMGD